MFLEAAVCVFFRIAMEYIVVLAAQLCFDILFSTMYHGCTYLANLRLHVTLMECPINSILCIESTNKLSGCTQVSASSMIINVHSSAFGGRNQS